MKLFLLTSDKKILHYVLRRIVHQLNNIVMYYNTADLYLEENKKSILSFR